MPVDEVGTDRTGVGLRWLSTRADIARWQAPIDTLLDRVGAPPPARRETLEPWFAHHPHVDPWGVLVLRHGEPVASVVLARTRRFGIDRFTAPGYPGSAHWLPAVDAPAAALLARTLAHALGRSGRPWTLYLTDLPVPDPTLDALRPELALAARWLGPPMARICFDPGQPLSLYLSRNTRAAVAKALNRMTRHGLNHALDWTTDPDAIAATIDAMVDVHRRRSLQQFGSSPLDDPRLVSLFGATVRGHARAGRVRLLTLRIDGALAAFALCEVTAGILWVDTNRASPDWLAFSPGTVVNAEILRMAHADPAITCVDWGGSVQRYKLSGHPTLVQLQRLQAWSSSAVRAVVAGERLALDAWARLAARAQAGGRRIRNSWSAPISK